MARTITIEIQRPTSHVVEVGIERGAPKLLQSKTVTPTTQQQQVTPDSGYYGLNEVTVEAVALQDKTVTPTEQVQVVEADEGYDGLNQVTVNAPAYPDLSWIMEAKVGNHPVVTAADINKIKDYIAQDNGAFGLLGYADGVTSIDFGDVDEVGAWALAQFARNITTLVSATFPALETINKERALSYIFGTDTALTSVSFPALETVSGSYAMYQMLYGCTGLTSVNFPTLESVSGSYALNQAFEGCTALTSLSFPSLTTVSGSNSMQNIVSGCTNLTTFNCPNLVTATNGSLNHMFVNNSYLEEISFPNLTTYTGGRMMHFGNTNDMPRLKRILLPKLTASPTTQSAFEEFAYNITSLEEVDLSSLGGTPPNRGFVRAFRGCTSLHTVRWGTCNVQSTNNNPWSDIFKDTNFTTFICHPYCLILGGTQYTLQRNLPNSVTTIELTKNANNNIYLLYQPNLTAATVKHILTKCDNTSMNGKVLSFYSSGLTVTDDAEGSIAALKASVVARGCTVNNLTINPYTP